MSGGESERPTRSTFISTFGRPLRLALVGGGRDSWIGEVHRIAARLDGLYEIVAGVFSSDPSSSAEFAAAQGIAADRAYRDWEQLIAREADREDRADVIAVMTPNDSHYSICTKALDASFDVICDKPLSTSLAASVSLVERSRRANRILAVTYCYSGYPMVRQARSMVRAGAIGTIRQIHVEYVQGWAAETDVSGWRMDPLRVGGSSILIDIATHAYHLASFVTGERATSVMADLGATVPGRVADDYAGMLLAFESGARGVFWTTTAAPGAEHGLMFKAFGDKGGFEWFQETPNTLTCMTKGDFSRVLTRRRSPLMTESALRATRTEIGHPEGYLEAFANIYSDVALHIAEREAGRVDTLEFDYPDATSGAEGLAFVEAATASHRDKRWAAVPVVR